MSSRTLARISLLAGLAALCSGWATTASAAAQPNRTWNVEAVVPVGLAPDDLHILFSGTGGTIKNEALTSPAGTISQSGGNQIDVTLNAKAAPGDAVRFSFTTQHSPVGVVSGTWTNGGSTIGAVNPDSVSVVCVGQVPGASSTVLIGLTLLMLGAGAYALRRRAIA